MDCERREGRRVSVAGDWIEKFPRVVGFTSERRFVLLAV
jgi:hypothetical protein